MSSANKTCSVAFTLPISCQICLGKVKQPVICPNQHVFCKVCMEFWLSRSPQCPACRIPITKDNPCRPVLGGLSEQPVSSGEDFSSRDMRRTRVEVLFKDYENEIERLERQNELLKEENKMLSESSSRRPGGVESNQKYNEMDSGRLKLLMQKLQDAGDVHDKQKREIKALREENKLLKEESGKTGIENQKLRMEVVSRSPRRYGRSTVIAMESQLEKYKKESAALNKALEKSDAYVEDLEKELAKYKKLLTSQTTGGGVSRNQGLDHANEPKKYFSSRGGHPKKLPNTDDMKDHRRIIPLDDEEDSLFDSSDTDIRVKSSNQKPLLGNDTFDLEMPSPMAKGSKALSKLALDTTDDEGLSFLKDHNNETDLFNNTDTTDNETLELPSPVQSAKKRLKFSEKEGSQTHKLSTENNKFGSNIRSSFDSTGSSTGLRNESHYSNLTTASHLTRHKEVIQSRPTTQGTNSMNTSMSGDIEDCMKLFEEAERKVERRRGHIHTSSEGDVLQSGDLLLNGNRSAQQFSNERSLSHPGSTGSSTAGLIAESNDFHPATSLKKSGSYSSLTASGDSASTFTMGHLNTEVPQIKPTLFGSSLPLPQSSLAMNSGTGTSGVISGSNTEGPPRYLASGNIPSQSITTAGMNGNFLSQPTSGVSMGGNFQGKYSASNPFAKSLSQESKRF